MFRFRFDIDICRQAFDYYDTVTAVGLRDLSPNPRAFKPVYVHCIAVQDSALTWTLLYIKTLKP